MPREDDDTSGGYPLAELAEGIETVQAWHIQVHDDDVGLQAVCQGHYFGSGFRFGADGSTDVSGEHGFDAVANYVVIVCNEDTQRAREAIG